MPLFVCLNYLSPAGIPLLQALLFTYPRILLFYLWTMLQRVGPLSLVCVVSLNIIWYTKLPFVITGSISPIIVLYSWSQFWYAYLYYLLFPSFRYILILYGHFHCVWYPIDYFFPIFLSSTCIILVAQR